MKLELNHLAAYLPYGLRLSVIKNYSIGDGFWQQKGNEADLEAAYLNVQLTHCKPILRPLSDLVIDENLIEDFIGLGNWCNAYDEYIDHWYPDSSYAKKAPYVIFEYFLANHYDVFGLIDNGLAIDINTIK